MVTLMALVLRYLAAASYTYSLSRDSLHPLADMAVVYGLINHADIFWTHIAISHLFVDVISIMLYLYGQLRSGVRPWRPTRVSLVQDIVIWTWHRWTGRVPLAADLHPR